MKKIIDAKGLACPQPVILTKKALEQEDEITVIVDNDTAAENVRRMGTKSGCTVDTEKKEDGTFHIHLSKKQGGTAPAETEQSPSGTFNDSCASDGPLVVVISSDRMGRGNDELGHVLMRSFIHTLLTLEPLPETLIFYNSGVKLTVKDSEVLDDLKKIEEAGVSILACGTCLNYFGISSDLACGIVSNMYDITSTMAAAGRQVIP
ncbi:MAG: sulfurtransferase-like selenium metabolism protein YedF [Deltaproteobacteria bacterium]